MIWFSGSIAQAVTEAKTRKAIFVVFVYGKDDDSKRLAEMIENAKISSKLQVESNFVAIKVESGTEPYVQFAQIYQLVPVPSIFFIGNNGTPLEVVAGGIELEPLVSKIDTVLTRSGKSVTSVPTAAASSSSFLAGEQSQTSKAAEKPTPKVEIPVKKADEEVEYETVCEGDTCVRRPKQKTPEKSVTNPEPTASTASDSQSEIPLEEKVERAKQLLEKKRLEKEEEEKKAAIQKELDRRNQGQGMAELKRWQEEQEMKNLKEERMREKLENQRAKARILEQIAQDKINRAAKFAPPAAEKTTPVTPPASSVPQTKSDDTITRIQFKMADGSTHLTRQNSDSTLGELRKYVKANIEISGTFSLSVAYPRQLLTDDQDAKTLQELGLTPSSTILIVQGPGGSGPKITGPGSPVAKATGFFAMMSQILWAMFVQPTQDIISYIRSWISGRPPTAGSSSSSGSSGQSLGGQIRRSETDSQSTIKRRKTGSSGNSGVSVIKKDGNTFRLRDRDSDDENNTWNGNSTQQM